MTQAKRVNYEPNSLFTWSNDSAQPYVYAYTCVCAYVSRPSTHLEAED